MNPLVAFGGGLVQTAADAVLQNMTNIQNRQFSREMYGRQRADALADWERQNTYNSPSAQMERLKAAKLNPNLVYGTGAATSSASPVRSSSSSGGQAQAPRVDLSAPFMGYADMAMKNAQMDALNETKKLTVLKQITEGEIALNKMADTKLKMQNTAGAKWKLDFNTANQETLSEIIRTRLEQMKTNITFTQHEDLRQQVMNDRNVIESMEKVLNYQKARAKTDKEIQEIDARIDNLKKDGRVKEFAAKLADSGVDPRSPWYVGIITAFLNSLNEKYGSGEKFPTDLSSPVEQYFKNRKNK